jgi:hypothetical protein
MHLKSPRIAPLVDNDTFTPEQRTALAGATFPGRAPLNIL